MTQVLVRVGLVTLLLAGILFWAFSGVKEHEEIADKAVEKQVPFDLEIADDSLATWREFTSTVGGFRVDFPAYPQHANEIVPVPNTDMYLEYNIYVAEPDKDSSFMLSLITYPKEMTVNRPENILQTVMNEMLLANPTNQLRQVSLGDYQGHPQLEFQIQNQDIHMWNRAIMVGHTLYLITVTATHKGDTEKSYARFNRSFELIKTNEGAAATSQEAPPQNRG